MGDSWCDGPPHPSVTVKFVKTSSVPLTPPSRPKPPLVSVASVVWPTCAPLMKVAEKGQTELLPHLKTNFHNPLALWRRAISTLQSPVLAMRDTVRVLVPAVMPPA